MKFCAFTLAFTAISSLFVATAAYHTDEDPYYRASYLDEPMGGGHVNRDTEMARRMLARAYLEDELDLASRYYSAIQSYKRYRLDTQGLKPPEIVTLTIHVGKVYKGWMGAEPPEETFPLQIEWPGKVGRLKAKLTTRYQDTKYDSVSPEKMNITMGNKVLCPRCDDGNPLSLYIDGTGGSSVSLEWMVPQTEQPGHIHKTEEAASPSDSHSGKGHPKPSIQPGTPQNAHKPTTHATQLSGHTLNVKKKKN